MAGGRAEPPDARCALWAALFALSCVTLCAAVCLLPSPTLSPVHFAHTPELWLPSRPAQPPAGPHPARGCRRAHSQKHSMHQSFWRQTHAARGSSLPQAQQAHGRAALSFTQFSPEQGAAHGETMCRRISLRAGSGTRRRGIPGETRAKSSLNIPSNRLEKRG